MVFYIHSKRATTNAVSASFCLGLGMKRILDHHQQRYCTPRSVLASSCPLSHGCRHCFPSLVERFRLLFLNCEACEVLGMVFWVMGRAACVSCYQSPAPHTRKFHVSAPV